MTLAPVPLVLAALAAVAYLVGVLRLRRTATPWPVLPALSFLGAGIPVIVVATCGPPAAQAGTSLAAYMVMLLLLALVAPIFLVWGRPVSLGRAVLGPRAGRVWSVFWDGPMIRVMTNPLVAPVLLLAGPVVVVATPLLLHSLQLPAVLAAIQVVLVLVGVMATLPLSQSESPDHGVPHAVAAFLAFFELVLDAIPGIVLTYTTTLVAGGWYAVHGVPGGQVWAASDQRTAGMLLWIVGEGLDLPFLYLVFRRWMREDAAEGARIDAELDARDAARDAAASRPTG